MGNLVWLHGAGLLTPGSVDECLMNAAAISRDSIDPASRLGSDIMKTCKRVTIYYSNADDTLLAGSVIDQWKELGRDGPDYSKTGAWAEQLYAVDCTDVVNRNNLHGAKLVHIAYYSIPQVLYDFIAVLSGKKQKIIKNRTAIGGTNNVGYKMMINSAQAD
jgi:esterase/lipase superfamily enzyme